MFTPEKCIGCAYCVAICPQHCHQLGAKGHDYSRDACEKCGLCTQKCYTGALEIIGKSMTVAMVLREVLSDQPFYESSRGGVTISGGEPMFQFDFTRALLHAIKAHGIHTCFDTSGFAPITRYQQILECVDIFLYDLKETDPERHLAYIGVPLAPILENLEQIDAWGSSIILRCPIIPNLNDRPEHFTQIAQYANRLHHLLAIDILPYHPLGKSKSQRLGKGADVGKSEFPPKAQIET
jgi:pyruvate formate lyase activating enzyme